MYQTAFCVQGMNLESRDNRINAEGEEIYIREIQVQEWICSSQKPSPQTAIHKQSIGIQLLKMGETMPKRNLLVMKAAICVE
jgi:hypothetical protein